MAVFVTDGDQRATLAVVRALGSAGIPVTVGESRPVSLAGSSRYCTKSVWYPSPLDEGEAFQNFLHEEMRNGRSLVLLPMTDVTMQLIGRNRSSLASLVRLPIPGEEEIRRAQDKQEVLLLARQLGIRVPETFVVNKEEDLEVAARGSRYPVVIKPRYSRFLQNGSWLVGPVEYARDSEDLLAKYRKSHNQIARPLIQEKIEGEGRGVFLLLWEGRLKAAFCHRRLREKPPWGGVSVYRESIPLDEELVQQSLALLQALGWQGVAMVEFKVDPRDGEAKLMEVNGRFWGSLQLAIDAGMNFPLLLYRVAIGETVAEQFNYKIGVKSRWLLGDLDHLLIRLARFGGPNGRSKQEVSRLRACFNFLRFYERDMHYEILRLGDPHPAWVECKAYIRDAVHRFAQRREGKSAR